MKIYLRIFRESFQFAMNSLVVNKLRTFLSLLGITLGIFVIIGVFTFVDSMVASIEGSLSELGNDIVVVTKWPISIEEGETEYAWWKYWQRPSASMADLKEMQKRLNKAEAICFLSDTRRKLEYYNSSISDGTILVSSHDFDKVYNLKVGQGRYFTENESFAGNNVAIIGTDIRDNLFGSIDPIGKTMKVDGKKVTVVGVFEKEGDSMLGNGFDEVVMLPVNFGKSIVDIRNTDNNRIWVKAKEGVSLDNLKGEILGKMRAIRKLRPVQEKNFSIYEMTLIKDLIGGVTGVLKTVGSFLGILSILVGGFNIANIMFVIVKERTNQIGIQKALGAKRSFIRAQFLFESIILCLIGGFIGLFLVWLISFLLGYFFTSIPFEIQLTRDNIILGIVISISIGVAAGFFPAWKASKLNPVDAIRST